MAIGLIDRIPGNLESHKVIAMVTFNASQFERRMINVYAIAAEPMLEGDDVVLEKIDGEEHPRARLARTGELATGEALNTVGQGMLVNVVVAELEWGNR